MPSFTYFSQLRSSGKDYQQLEIAQDNEKGQSRDVASEDSTTPLILHKELKPSFSIVVLVFCIISMLLLCTDIYLRLGMGAERAFDIKSPVPEIPLKMTSFDASEEWLDLPGPESNKRWMAEIGPSDGFLGIPNPRDYSSKVGIEGIGGENYGISMFHGLHCLVLVRQAWYEARTTDLNVTHARSGLMINYSNLASGHVAHCLDYLRNAIKCAGDMTLEWALEPGSRKLDAMGGEMHVCRDFSAARQFMDGHLPFPKPR